MSLLLPGKWYGVLKCCTGLVTNVVVMAAVEVEVVVDVVDVEVVGVVGIVVGFIASGVVTGLNCAGDIVCVFISVVIGTLMSSVEGVAVTTTGAAVGIMPGAGVGDVCDDVIRCCVI